MASDLIILKCTFYGHDATLQVAESDIDPVTELSTLESLAMPKDEELQVRLCTTGGRVVLPGVRAGDTASSSDESIWQKRPLQWSEILLIPMFMTKSFVEVFRFLIVLYAPH